MRFTASSLTVPSNLSVLPSTPIAAQPIVYFYHATHCSLWNFSICYGHSDDDQREKHPCHMLSDSVVLEDTSDSSNDLSLIYSCHCGIK